MTQEGQCYVLSGLMGGDTRCCRGTRQWYLSQVQGMESLSPEGGI